MKNLLPLLVLLLILSSCSTSQGPGLSPSDDESYNIAVDLTTRLKGYAGIRVLGNGPAAKIFARGVNSITGSNQPLFILDGNQVPDYPELYRMVNTSSIKRIEVLVRPEDIGIYGVRGANGVIKVTTQET